MVFITAYSACLPDGHDLVGAAPSDADWFDVGDRLGRRGYRQLPLPAQLTLAAVRGLPAVAGSDGSGRAGSTHGVWVGSSTAAAHCISNLDRDIVQEGAEAILPTAAPYFSVNVVPSRAVGELGATGPSTTITTVGTAAVDALIAARRALALGRVREATVVAVEVPDPDQIMGGPDECGAIAFRLRAGWHSADTHSADTHSADTHSADSADIFPPSRLAGAAAFCAGAPETAAKRILDGWAEPVRRAARVLSAGPLAAVSLFASAVAAATTGGIVITDSAGGAAGVTCVPERGEQR